MDLAVRPTSWLKSLDTKVGTFMHSPDQTIAKDRTSLAVLARSGPVAAISRTPKPLMLPSFFPRQAA